LFKSPRRLGASKNAECAANALGRKLFVILHTPKKRPGRSNEGPARFDLCAILGTNYILGYVFEGVDETIDAAKTAAF